MEAERIDHRLITFMSAQTTSSSTRNYGINMDNWKARVDTLQVEITSSQVLGITLRTARVSGYCLGR